MFFMWRTAALRVAQSLLTVSLAVGAASQADMAHARGLFSGPPENSVAAADLPRQGQQTYLLILQGGPFPHDKDGSVFGNRERLLPRERRGYYREYTVETPGSRDRGARRIVCGGVRVKMPDVCYYTSDHYSSFRMIVP